MPNKLLTLESSKAQQALDALIAQFEAGEISTEADLLNAVAKAYVDLYTNISEPNITPVPVGTTYPRYESLRDPLVQLEGDFKLAADQLRLLRRGVESLAMQITGELAGLNDLYSQAVRQLINLQVLNENTGVWKTDTFTSLIAVDTSQTSADVDTNAGIVTLGVDSMLSVRDKISSVSVDHSVSPVELPKTQQENAARTVNPVDGIPGNPIEVASVGTTPTGMSEVDNTIKEPTAVQFVGDTHPERSNLVSLFDEDNSSWFEWGAYVVPDNQYLKRQGLAYISCDASQGKAYKLFGISGVTEDLGWKFNIPWPGTTEVSERSIVSPWYLPDTPRCQLNMVVTIRFNSPMPVSWIEILPQLINNCNAKLVAVTASPDGNSNWTDILKRRDGVIFNSNLDQSIIADELGISSKNTSGAALVQCAIPSVAAIRMHFIQETSYETTIGHKFTIEQYSDWQVGNAAGAWDTGDLHSVGKVSMRKGILTDFINSHGGVLDFTPNLTWHEYHSQRKVPILFTSEEERRNFGGFTFMQTQAAADFWGTGISALYHFSEASETLNVYDIFKAYRYSIAVKNISMYSRQYASSSAFVSKAHLFADPITAVTLTVLDTIPENWPITKKWLTYQISADGSTWYDIEPDRTGSAPGTTVHFDAPTHSVRLRIIMERPEDRPRETPVVEYYALQAVSQEF